MIFRSVITINSNIGKIDFIVAVAVAVDLFSWPFSNLAVKWKMVETILLISCRSFAKDFCDWPQIMAWSQSMAQYQLDNTRVRFWVANIQLLWFAKIHVQYVTHSFNAFFFQFSSHRFDQRFYTVIHHSLSLRSWCLFFHKSPIMLTLPAIVSNRWHLH